MSSEALAWVRLCQTSDFEVGESNQRAACHHLIPGDRQEEQEAHQNPPLWNPPRRNQGFRALWRVEVVLESAKVLKTIKEAGFGLQGSVRLRSRFEALFRGQRL